MPKYKNTFAKGYTPKWSEEVSVIKKVNNTVSLTYFINGIDRKEIVGKAYEKELQMTNETEFRGEKVMWRKNDELHVKWEGCDNSLNSWIDKKDISM